MEREYRVIRNYGTDLKHPVSKDAIFVCQISRAAGGPKTLTPWILQAIEDFYPDSTFTQVL